MIRFNKYNLTHNNSRLLRNNNGIRGQAVKVLKRVLCIVLISVIFNTSAIPAQEIFPTQLEKSSTNTYLDLKSVIVTKIYFKNRDELNYLSGILDIWEANHEEKFVIAACSSSQFDYLQQLGYRVEIDQLKTAQILNYSSNTQDQSNGVPNFQCYRTVKETYQTMKQLALDHPTLAIWKDIGDSWQKYILGQTFGHDIYVLIISNQYNYPPAVKPKLFILAGIHPREYATVEIATRYAEHLLMNYGIDPEISWVLDYNEIHIIPIANPDGRILAELGYGQRKNINNLNGGQCISPPTWENQFGTDLNRNHTFQWGNGSSDPCAIVFQGVSPGSEPETQVIESYLRSIFPDQRGLDVLEPAPLDTSGLLISLHSYGELILWPWGWTEIKPPNETGLSTLGHKLAFFNGYKPDQSYYLYQTTGDTDDFAYGELGIASFTFELGTEFFEDCNLFETSIYPKNLNALLYAAKSARLPYQNPAGPDIIDISLEPEAIIHGNTFTMTATADDNRYYPGVLAQNISDGRFSIDSPSWISGTKTLQIQSQDLFFDNSAEPIMAIVDTTDLALGQHKILIESLDSNGNWGVPGSAYFEVISNTYVPSIEIPDAVVEVSPGFIFTQTILIANQGIITDTINIGINNNLWNASLESNQVGPLPPGGKSNIELRLEVPFDVQDGMFTKISLIASSLGDPSIFVEKDLVAKVHWYHLFTPLVSR